jgi:ribosomal protein S18 acetylase RimI-like enzyme
MRRFPADAGAGKSDSATPLAKGDFTIREEAGVCYLTPRSPGQEWQRAAQAGLSFRRARDADLPFLARVHAASGADAFAAAPWPESKKAAFVTMQFNLQHLHQRKEHPQADWLVIMRGGEDAGRLYLERRGSWHRIIDLALLPEHRGKGAGEALLRDLMDEAASCGKSLWIHVEKINPAMRLLRRLGFTVEEDNGLYEQLQWKR